MIPPQRLLLLAFWFVPTLLLHPIAIAQQIPSISVPTFVNDTSLVVRQNVCDRFRRYDRGAVELRHALQGFELRPLIILNGFLNLATDAEGNKIIEPTNPGIMAVLLDELAERGGFTWRNSFGITPRLLPNSNRSYTELLVWGTDNFDVLVGRWVKNLERLKAGVSFPEGYYDASYILVGVAKPPGDNTTIDLWQWLEPFDPYVWLCIVITIVVSGVLFQILDYVPPKEIHVHQDNKRKQRRPIFNAYCQQRRHDNNRYPAAPHQEEEIEASERAIRRTSSMTSKEGAVEAMYAGAHTIGDGIFLSSLLFTQHFQFMPRTAPSRLFSASMGLWALLISSNYTANLASFFVIENTPTLAVQSIDDAIQAGYPICIWKNSASASYITQQYPQAKYVETNNDAGDMFRALREGDCLVGVSSVSTLELYRDQQDANPDCNLVWVGRTIKFVPAGFGVKADAGTLCSSLINEVLNLHLVEMEAEGIVKKAWEDHVAKSQDQNCAAMLGSANNNSEESGSRSIVEMAGVFILHLVFAVAAIALMVLNRLWSRFQLLPREEFFSKASFVGTASPLATSVAVASSSPPDDTITGRRKVYYHCGQKGAPPNPDAAAVACYQDEDRQSRHLGKRQVKVDNEEQEIDLTEGIWQEECPSDEDQELILSQGICIEEDVIADEQEIDLTGGIKFV